MSVFLLPGMGADSSVFRTVHDELPSLTVLGWRPSFDNETLPDYGRRLAAELPPERSLLVGGMSFGGMVAIEMARALGDVDCVLISSVTGPERLPLRVRVAVIAGRALPRATVALAQQLARTVNRMVGRFIGAETRVLLDQFSSADPGFLKWAADALASWQPGTSPIGRRLHQLHGSRDWIIPPSCAPEAVMLEGGGHVMAVTHPVEVIRFLKEIALANGVGLQ